MKFQIFQIAAILIVSIFLISACAAPGFDFGLFGGGQGLTSSGEGIDIQFLENQPPTKELYEGQKFRVGIDVLNYGLENNEVNLCVSDSLASYFEGILETCKIVIMRNAEISGNNILPDEKKVYFPSQDQLYSYSNVEENTDTTITANAYYKFKTTANAQLCLKKDIETETPVKCDASSQEQITQNAAPVKITSLEKTIFPSGRDKIELQLMFVIANNGPGEVIDKNLVKSREIKEPKIDLSLDLKGITKQFDCTPLRDNRITFNEEQKTITCSTTVNIKEDFFENPLEITLEYGYKIKKTIGPINVIAKEK